MMEEKRMDFLKDTSYAIAKMRMKYDEMDEKTVYKKGIKKGMRKGVKKGVKQGKISLLKELLRQKWELTESDEKVLDDLNEAKVNQIVKVLNRINTSEDLHEQLKKLSDSKRQPDNRNQFSFSHDLSREII
ncbi:hypothetical protein [Holdemania filiformis]|uniref:hypothetical protein n=1 Tax=Holdemania filiformis TaxID=61171 RepID=UPI00242DF02F|nr:hypothetical protein [Holdemania filiformis]